MADGSIKFDSKINTSGFLDGVSSIKRAAKACASTTEKAGSRLNDAFNKSAQISALEAQIDQTEAKIKQLTAEMQKMEQASIPTGEYKELSKLVDKTQLKLESLLEKQEKMESQGASQKSSRWKSLQYDIDQTQRQLGIYKAELQDTVDRERAFTSGSSQSAYNKKAAAIDSLNNKLYVQRQRLQGLIEKETESAVGASRLQEIGDNAEISDLQVAELNDRLQELVARQKELQSAGVGLGYKEYDENIREIADLTAQLNEYKSALQSSNAGHNIFTSGLNAAVRAGRKLLNVCGQLAGTTVKGLGKAAKSAAVQVRKLGKALFFGEKKTKAMGRGMAGMLKRMVLFSLVHKMISGIGKAFQEGVQNFAGYSKGFNAQVSSFVSSLGQLKNSFAAAFAPITSAVIPVLDALIQKLIQVTNVAGQFIAAITGKSTFIKAVKVNEDYAKSLKKTGAAAKKALAPFDELNQISDNSSSAQTDPSQMFEEVSIDSDISNFARTVKELISAGDWAGIGQLIGEKINDGVQSFSDFISWDKVGTKITQFVTRFSSAFNSLVNTVDWRSIGKMIGTGVNTLTNTLYLLLTQIDWQRLGLAIAQGLNGILTSVDWDHFGATIGAFFQAKLSALYGFVMGVDWGAIGQAIGNSLNGLFKQIDWPMLGLMLAKGFSGVFAVLGNFAATFDWTGFGASIASSLSLFFQNFDWIGAGTAISDFVLGLLDAFIALIKETDWLALGEGLADTVMSIDWWGILLKVIDAILQTLKAVVLALWPVLSEAASFLWEGLCEGIKKFFSAPGEFIKKNITDPFIKYFKELFGIHSPSKVMAEMGQYLWEGFCNGIKRFFANPVSFIKETITGPFLKGIKSLLGIHSPSTVLADIGSNTVAGFNQGVSNEQASSQNVIQSWAKGVSSWFADKFGIGGSDASESKKWAASIMSGFNNTVNQQYTNSQAAMEKWAESVRKWFTGSAESNGVNVASWKRFAENIITAFKTKIAGSYTETQGGIQTWSKNVKEWFWGNSNLEGAGGMYAAFYNMAKRVNEGFAKGISDFSYLAKNAVKKWAGDVMEKAREKFDIHSPSKEFHSIAEYVVRGFDEGLQDMMKSSQDTARQWLDGILGVFDGIGISVPVGLNIHNASAYLPRIGTGTVTPPKAGDIGRQNGGTVEDTAFVGTIRQAVLEALGDYGGGDIHLTVELDGEAVYENVVKRNRQSKKRTGKNPLLA